MYNKSFPKQKRHDSQKGRSNSNSFVPKSGQVAKFFIFVFYFHLLSGIFVFVLLKRVKEFQASRESKTYYPSEGCPPNI